MSVIKLFNQAFVGNKVSFAEINLLGVRAGYIVHPNCCTHEVLTFLKEQTINVNATFYRSWNDIISKSRFSLFLDQLRHYASTYGTNHEGFTWVANEGSDQPEFTTLKVIFPITVEEANKRCCDILYSGIALSATTLEMILPLVTDIDIEKVKNKEALMNLHKKFGTVPIDNIEFVRYLIYLVTSKTLLIKDKATIDALKEVNSKRATKIDLTKLVNQFGIEKLSEVFFRFKPIFLALKKGNENTVNQLRRLANKNHKPMKIGFFEAILSDSSLVFQLEERLKDCSNFKKVLLLQTILIRQRELDMRFFGIRNGKLWAKAEKTSNKVHYSAIFAIVYKSLIESLSKKATSVKIPSGIKLTIPTSEKSFCGNFPLGTSFDLSGNDSIIGINWRSIDGVHDLDLSLMSIDGKKYGWNAAYTNNYNSIIYSGDMTSANPEATELFYNSGKGFNSCLVKVNLYNGENGSKFKIFLAKEKIVNMSRGYMVNPNNILFNIDSTMDSKEKVLGVITDNKFILAQFRTGNKQVSGDSITNKYIDYALNTLNCYIDLESVLIDAGYSINTSNEKIDLTNLSKDTLISMFSE